LYGKNTETVSLQEEINYNRIAEAIEYIKRNFKDQPNLEEVAGKVNLSSFHFQRLFSEWAGTTPKKFLQYISIQHAKTLLKDQQATLLETAFETGLSGSGRLHDLFVKIEGMTPAEYKNGAKNLTINFSFAESPFGNVLVASTTKGICYMTFAYDENTAFNDLKYKFPNATFHRKLDLIQQNALFIFQKDGQPLADIKLHLKGTEFQLNVWEALLKIPMGNLSSYGYIAQKIGNTKASRAVGTAIGSNPVAYLIPCHRVIQASGNIGEYRWGSIRKTAIIGWESSQLDAIQT
jgi:AraC family transcriptional regulator, regulatory protein of adaptative response / methylated-DNA-[protein]-cysteine methyltransferase